MTTQTKVLSTNEALKLAFEALKNITNYEGLADAREAIKEALAQQSNEQVEPCRHVATFMGEYHGYHGIVGWDNVGCLDNFPNGVPVKGTKLYTHPPIPTAQPHDCTRSHPHEEMSKECELRTEIARLTNCLKRANAQAEHLEREWYLRGDEIERLTAQPKEPEQEPVAITITGKLGNIYSFTGDYSLKKGDKVYTTPPQRKPLTDAQAERLYRNIEPSRQQDARSLAAFKRLLRVIEAAQGIKE